MKRLAIVLALLGASIEQSAHAGWFHTAVCDAWEASPGYWAVKGIVAGLKASGGLTSLQECYDIGDVVSDGTSAANVPTGSLKDCVCESFSWPPATPGVCSDPHSACATGGPLGASTAMMSCQASATEDVASKVCLADPYCCETAWDQQCEGEATTAFWNSMDSQQEAIVARMDTTCDQKSGYISTLQQEVNADTSQLPCLGTKNYSLNVCGNQYDFQYSFNGKCMGVSGGHYNTNGTPIVPWTCNAQPPSYTGATDQAWIIDPNDCIPYTNFSGNVTTNFCTIRNGENYNKCLAMGNAGSVNNGTGLVIYDCLGQSHIDQYWNVSAPVNGVSTITNLGSARALTGLGIHANSSSFTLSTPSPASSLAVTP